MSEPVPDLLCTVRYQKPNFRSKQFREQPSGMYKYVSTGSRVGHQFSLVALQESEQFSPAACIYHTLSWNSIHVIISLSTEIPTSCPFLGREIRIVKFYFNRFPSVRSNLQNKNLSAGSGSNVPDRALISVAEYVAPWTQRCWEQVWCARCWWWKCTKKRGKERSLSGVGWLVKMKGKGRGGTLARPSCRDATENWCHSLWMKETNSCWDYSRFNGLLRCSDC